MCPPTCDIEKIPMSKFISPELYIACLMIFLVISLYYLITCIQVAFITYQTLNKYAKFLYIVPIEPVIFLNTSHSITNTCTI